MHRIIWLYLLGFLLLLWPPTVSAFEVGARFRVADGFQAKALASEKKEKPFSHRRHPHNVLFISQVVCPLKPLFWPVCFIRLHLEQYRLSQPLVSRIRRDFHLLPQRT